MATEPSEDDIGQEAVLSLTPQETQETPKQLTETSTDATELAEMGHVSTVDVRGEETQSRGNREFCVKMSTIPRQKVGGILKNARASLGLADDDSVYHNNNVAKDVEFLRPPNESDEQTSLSVKFGPDSDTAALVSNASEANGLILPTKVSPVDHEDSDADKNNRSLKVSWSETVVYTSAAVAGGEDNPTYEASDSPPPTETSREHDVGRQRTLSDPFATQRQKQNDGTTNKCCVVIATIFITFAIIGLIVLGVMYALRLGEKRHDNDPVKLRSKLNLRSAVAGDLFVGAWRARGSGERGLLYLVADGDLMPWQKPSRAVSFMWHRGAPLMVYSLTPSGLTRAILGDPIESEGASFSLLLQADTWHAARVFDKGTYALFSVVSPSGSAFNWTAGNQFQLEQRYPSVSVIATFSRR